MSVFYDLYYPAQYTVDNNSDNQFRESNIKVSGAQTENVCSQSYMSMNKNGLCLQSPMGFFLNMKQVKHLSVLH